MSNEKAQQQYIKMTQTPILRLLITLSIPTIIGMMCTMIYNLVDTAFVGRLGTSQSGAVGVVFGFMAIIQAAGFMFGQGAGALLSRNLGEKNNEEATIIASTGFFSALAVGIIILVAGLTNLDSLVMILGSTKTIAPYAYTYMRFILMATPLMVTSFTLNNFLRYEGKAFLGVIGLMTGGLLNIAGDAVFMFVFKMGIAGAGLSTALSQTIGFIILLSMFLTGKTQTKISIRKVVLTNNRLLNIVTTGLPSLLRQSLASLGTIVLNLEASRFSGDAAVAAMSIVTRVSFGVFSVALGIAQGFQPISAFNYGAKKYRRLRDAYKYTLIAATIVLVILSGLMYIAPDKIIRIFRDDDEVVLIGIRALLLLCTSQVFIPVCMVTEMMMQTTGRKLIASFLSSLRTGLLYIPLMLILPEVRGLKGVEEAQPAAYILSVPIAVFFACRFFKEIPREDYDSDDEGTVKKPE